MTRKFSEHTESGIDADTNSVSSSLEITENDWICYNVLDGSGTHSTHVVTLQCSANNIDWYDTASTITGLGIVDNVQIGARYVRLKVTTVEGATSTIDILIQAK